MNRRTTYQRPVWRTVHRPPVSRYKMTVAALIVVIVALFVLGGILGQRIVGA